MIQAADKPHRFSQDVTDALVAFGLMILGLLDLAGRPLLFAQSPRGGRPLPSHEPPPTLARPFFPEHGATPLSYVLMVFAFAPLALRRRFPLVVLAVVTAAAALYSAMPNPPSILFIAPLIAVYTVGVERDRRTVVVSAVAAATMLVGASFVVGGVSGFWTSLVVTTAPIAVAASFGDATRVQRAYVAAIELRAAEAERSREEEALRRVDEERLRIARELHDVVAHSLSIIAVQSGAAVHVIDSDPAQARRSLDAIRLTSKEALDELRSMLGVLRTQGDADAPLAPVPGLERIEDLVEPVRAAGYEVRVITKGSLADVPMLVDASAYRVVQEALTNVVRHAGPAKVDVAVIRDVDTLTVSVDDDGRGSAGALPGGHGLTGMRERVTALGGTFSAGPRDGGGYSVRASVPLVPKGSSA
jgi:signal transduction histidine kinase